MRQPAQRRLVQGLILLASTAIPATAFPFPRDELHDLFGFGFLMPRQCVAYCGSSQACCSSGEVCYTSTGGGAGCVQGGAGYPLYTTTWTETETFTSTAFGNYPTATWPLATTPIPATVTCTPQAGSGQTFCGNICCTPEQTCVGYEGNIGTCNPAAGAGAGGSAYTAYTTVYTSSGQVVTTEFSAALRQTGSGSGAVTVTQTGSLASASQTTSGNGTIVNGESGGSGLSPGAIAGIVIGVLVALVILLVLCACCIVRGLWHGLLDLLGLRKKERHRSRETVIEEEEYRRTDSVHSRRDRHGGWYGGGGGRPTTVASRRTEKRKTNDGAGWLGLAGAGATLLVLLGLRRDKKRRQNEKARSNVSSAYYSDSYTASSPSSRSTRRSYPSRRSGATRNTRASRQPSRRSPA